MSSNKTVKKGIRLTPELAEEIQSRMARNGISDFNGFCEQAIRHFLNHLKACDLITPYETQAFLRAVQTLEQDKKQALTPIDLRKIAAEVGLYKSPDSPQG